MSSKDSSVIIQTSSQSIASTPSWFGEVAVIAQYLRHVGVLTTIEERVRFARRRFGYYDVIDFVVVLLGYAMSGERTLEAFYESVQPFAAPFMALFGRERLPHRSTLSRFLAALGQATVEALRTVFLEDLAARPLEKEERTGGLWDRQVTHPETGTCRSLFDFPDLLLSPTGPRARVIVAAREAPDSPVKVGTTRGERVYELFYTALPPGAFTSADVVALYLHRGAFETVLADEDKEQEPDRWCSHTAWGQECWLIVAQWTWNLRLELGHALHPTPMRTTEFAPVRSPEPVAKPDGATQSEVSYQPPVWAVSRMGCLAGEHFTPQPDGTLHCPAGFPLYPQERRSERDGSVRVIYAARIGHCRPCPRREECQGYGTATQKPRPVSAVLWPRDTTEKAIAPPPLPPASHPILWGDWQRCFHRRAVVKLLHHQRVEVRLPETAPPAQPPPIRLISRAERAHYRLSWEQRLARNTRAKTAPEVSIKLFGIPDAFATSLGLRIA